MNNDTLKIGVVITLLGTTATEESIGLYSGELRFSETGATISGKATKADALAAKWVGTISRSVDIRRNGNYAAVNGADIKVSNNFGLLEWLQANNVGMYSSKVQVIYEYTDEAGAVTSGYRYTGIVTNVRPYFDYITITTDSLSRGYRSPASSLIRGSDRYKPVFIGSTPEPRTKGVYVSGEDKDIPFGATNLIWRCFYSDPDNAFIEPVNDTLTTEELGEYRDQLREINLNANKGRVILKVIAGEGEGTRLHINEEGGFPGVNPLGLLVALGYPDPDDGVVGRARPGTGNFFPGGITGVRYQVSSDFEERDFIGEPSLVKFVEVNNYVQMDGWASTVNGWDGTAEDYVDGEYIPAASYRGVWVNDGDRMVQAADKGDTQIDFTPIRVSPVFSAPILNVYQSDFLGLDINDFPEEIQKFYVFDQVNWATDSAAPGFWANFEQFKLPITEHIGGPADIVDGSTATSWVASMLRRTINGGDNGTTRMAFAFKCGIPAVTSKPEKLYFTGKIKTRSLNNSTGVTGVDQAVIVLINTFTGWKVLQYKYGDNLHSNTAYPTAPDSEPGDENRRYLLDNLYPLSVSEEVDGAAYDYWDPNFDGNRTEGSMLVNRSGFELDIADYLLQNQEEFYVLVCASSNNGGLLDNLVVEVEEVALTATYASQPGNTVFGYDSRESTTNMGPTYDHFLRLQDFTLQGVPKPSNGWGSAYPTPADWSLLVDSGTGYGGTGNPSISPDAVLAGQKLDDKTGNTEAVKKELCKAAWCMGTVSSDGVEKMYPVVQALSAVDGALVEYADIDGEYRFTPKNYADIFTRGKVQYNFDNGAGKFLGEITVSNVDAPSFQSIYVTGVDDPDEAATLWRMANRLYKTYGVINSFPDDVGKIPLVHNQEGAVSFFKDLYRWQGVVVNPDNTLTTLERYQSTFNLGLDYIIENGIDHGSKIRLEIPTITVGTEYHRGIVTGISEAITIKSSVRVTADMLGDITAGGVKKIIKETGAAATIYKENGAAAKIIREGD